MSEHSTQFEAAGGGLVLRGAILLYRSEGPRNFSSHGPHRGDAAAFASMHAVEHDEEGRPTRSRPSSWCNFLDGLRA